VFSFVWLVMCGGFVFCVVWCEFDFFLLIFLGSGVFMVGMCLFLLFVVGLIVWVVVWTWVLTPATPTLWVEWVVVLEVSVFYYEFRVLVFCFF